MDIRKITEHTTSDVMKSDAYVLVTQTELVENEEVHGLRRVPLQRMATALGFDVEYDAETQLIYLVDRNGGQIGTGATVKAGLDGLEIKAEDDYDDDGNIVQYIALYDEDGNRISRTEVSINVSSVTAGDNVKLVNTTKVNGTTTNSLTSVYGSEDGVTLTFNFYIYDSAGDLVQDNGTARFTINGTVVGYSTITQGSNAVHYFSGQGGQLAIGDNTIVIKVTDSNGNSRSLTYSVTVVNLRLESRFDNNAPFIQSNLPSGAITFPYNVYGGDISKTVHFELDGTVIDTITTRKYNTELTYLLSGLTHGNHILRVWMTATVNNESIESNTLRYDILYVRTNGTGIIMAIDREENTKATQGDVIYLKYLLYAPGTTQCNMYYQVQYEATNPDTGSLEWRTYSTSPTYTVDRTKHDISIKDYPAGNVRIRFYASTTTSSSSYNTPIRVLFIDVAASDLALSISTDSLGLYMDAAGRSNGETSETVSTWRDSVNSSVRATLTGFDWQTNGWIGDQNGDTALKVSGGATVSIPFYPFATSPIATGANGATIELDFMTDEVSDTDAVLLSCMVNGIGFRVTAEEILFSTSAHRMSTQFQPGKRMRVAFVIDAPSSTDKLIHMYINGVDGSGSGVKAFDPTAEIIQQNAPITITSTGAAIWVYAIRVYNTAKNPKDTATNYIASLPSISEQAAEYNLNQIFDSNSNLITRGALLAAVPDMTVVVITGPKLPTAIVRPDGEVEKEDARVDGQIIDKDDTLCVSFTNQKFAVQGTSSASYYRKNYKLTISECFLTSDPTKVYSGYTLRADDTIRAKKFCFKADVASSEQANNVLLARLYNDACPYASPAQVVDSNVRQGIDGKPCVIFYTCTDPTSADYNDGQPTFIGKYNFNIDKGSENVFGFDQEDENGNLRWPNAQSWEFRNNTSPRTLFQSADFVTMRNGKPEWMSDFEARYPEDSTDTTLFAQLCRWIASTNTASATNNALPSRYTVPSNRLMRNAVIYETHADEDYNPVYLTVIDGNGFERRIVESSRFVTETIEVEGVQYNVMPIDDSGNELYYHDHDTANYRQEVFYQEFSQHFNVSDAAFYYVFTEFFLMVDNRAKNMFVTTYDGVTWMFLPYDFDTALGIDNEGELSFSYGLEATDTVDGAYVFNDHMQSVLWTNFMNTFGNEIAATFQNTESAGWLDPDDLVTYFSNHQESWPIMLWNEDQRFKYSPSLTGGGSYLAMWQGKKEAQRPWWIHHRSIYLCSKYLSESALADVITFRVYSPDPNAENLSAAVKAAITASIEAVPPSSDMTITPYQDVYVNVKWGSYSSQTRAFENTPVLMETPSGAGTVNDTETYVYSASAIKSLGNLAGLYVGYIDVSKAIHLESLLLGSENSDYANTNCNSVTVGNNTALKTIDVRGLTSLTSILALANCPNITEIYAERTSLAAVTTPNGGCITTIHLPATVTSISLCNQTMIEDYSCAGYSNVASLRVENCPLIEADLKNILAACTHLTHVRLVNVDWQEDSADMLIRLSQLGGLDENGGTINTAVVTGAVHITNCSADDLSTIRRAFPYLNVTYTTATARLTFVNAVNSEGVGGETLFTLDVPYGSTGYYPYDQLHSEIPMPTLTSSAQYSYTFTGWSGSITNVTASRTITALYDSTVRSYPVVWKNGNTTLRTDTNKPYGTVIEWDGATPTTSVANAIFAGWNFTNTNDAGGTTTVSDALSYTVVGETVAEASFIIAEIPSQPTAFASCTWGNIIALIEAAYDGTLRSKTGYDTLQDYGWAAGDEQVITLKNGESVTLKIWGFDVNVDEDGHTLPVTIGNKYGLLNRRQMNSAARYLYGYTVSDNAGDASVTTERTASDYEAYEMNGTALPGTNTLTFNVKGAGTAEIVFTKPTWLSTIAVTDANTTYTYNFTGGRSTENPASRMDTNYFAQEDCSAFAARAGVVLHSGSTTFNYTNASGVTSPTITVDGTNGSIKVFDRSLSAVDNNYCAIEFTAGAKISIPFTGAGKIVITARGIWNGGGHVSSTLRAWLKNTYIDLLPAVIQSRLVPVKRISGIGGLDWDSYNTFYDKVFLPTYRELGFGSATTQPYSNENNKPFATFSSNEMRLVSCHLGDESAGLAYVWASSPHGGYVNYFIIINSASGSHNTSSAYNSCAVLPGFCLR